MNKIPSTFPQRRDKLITLTPQERQNVLQQAKGDLRAVAIAEAQANHAVRFFIMQLTTSLEMAVQHPQDVDCARLLRAVRAVVIPEAVGTV